MAYTDLSSPYFGEEEMENLDDMQSTRSFSEDDGGTVKDPYEMFFAELPAEDGEKDLEKLGGMYTEEDLDRLNGLSETSQSFNDVSRLNEFYNDTSPQLAADLDAPYCDDEDDDEDEEEEDDDHDHGDDDDDDDDDDHELPKDSDQMHTNEKDSHSHEPYVGHSDVTSDGPKPPSQLSSLDDKSEGPKPPPLVCHSDQSNKGEARLRNNRVGEIIRRGKSVNNGVPNTPPPPYIDDDGDDVNSSYNPDRDDEDLHTTAPPLYSEDDFDTMSTPHASISTPNIGEGSFPPLLQHKKSRSAPNVLERLAPNSTDITPRPRHSHRRSKTTFLNMNTHDVLMRSRASDQSSPYSRSGDDRKHRKIPAKLDLSLTTAQLKAFKNDMDRTLGSAKAEDMEPLWPKGKGASPPDRGKDVRSPRTRSKSVVLSTNGSFDAKRHRKNRSSVPRSGGDFTGGLPSRQAPGPPPPSPAEETAPHLRPNARPADSGAARSAKMMAAVPDSARALAQPNPGPSVAGPAARAPANLQMQIVRGDFAIARRTDFAGPTSGLGVMQRPRTRLRSKPTETVFQYSPDRLLLDGTRVLVVAVVNSFAFIASLNDGMEGYMSVVHLQPLRPPNLREPARRRYSAIPYTPQQFQQDCQTSEFLIALNSKSGRGLLLKEANYHGGNIVAAMKSLMQALRHSGGSLPGLNMPRTAPRSAPRQRPGGNIGMWSHVPEMAAFGRIEKLRMELDPRVADFSRQCGNSVNTFCAAARFCRDRMGIDMVPPMGVKVFSVRANGWFHLKPLVYTLDDPAYEAPTTDEPWECRHCYYVHQGVRERPLYRCRKCCTHRVAIQSEMAKANARALPTAEQWRKRWPDWTINRIQPNAEREVYRSFIDWTGQACASVPTLMRELKNEHLALPLGLPGVLVCSQMHSEAEGHLVMFAIRRRGVTQSQPLHTQHQRARQPVTHAMGRPSYDQASAGYGIDQVRRGRPVQERQHGGYYAPPHASPPGRHGYYNQQPYGQRGTPNPHTHGPRGYSQVRRTPQSARIDSRDRPRGPSWHPTDTSY